MVAALLTLAVTIASPATFEARTPQYSLAVTLDGGHYDIRVATIDNREIFAEKIASLPQKVVRDVGDLHFIVELSSSPQNLVATMNVEEGEMLVDSMHASWSVAKRRDHIRGSSAMHVAPPVAVHRVEPKYPHAGLSDLRALVIVDAAIDKTGAVTDVTVLKPMPFGLSEAAVDALKQWKFLPGTLDGQPVDMIMTVTVIFQRQAER